MRLLDDAGLTEKGVIPRSKAQRWRLIRAGQFPRPIKLGSRNAWLESEVDEWLRERVAARDATVAALTAGCAPAVDHARRAWQCRDD